MARTKMIFDNDGVNIDSEDLAMRIMDDWGVAFIKHYRPDITEKELPKDFIYTTYPGTSTDVIVAKLIEKFNLPVDQILKDNNAIDVKDASVKLADRVTLATIDRFKVELNAVPGTTEALFKIREMFGAENVALATTSRKDRMDVSLSHATDPVTGENAQLATLFPEGDRRYSGYEVSNKYNKAFEILGWNPAESIIVEDSKSGVEKAMAGRPEAAVIGTVAARFYVDKESQATALLDKGAKIVISNMADLPMAAEWLRNDMAPQVKPEFNSTVYVPPTLSGRGPVNNPTLGLN